MTDNLPPDFELVRSLQKGDVRAFDRLFAKYGGKLFYLAKGYLGSREEAEGLVQEVFIKVWENRKNIKEHLSFRSYLFTITYNLIRKFFRAKYRKQEFLEEFMKVNSGLTNEETIHIEYVELLEQVDLIVEKLPPRQKQIFKLSREEGLSHKEIARILSLRPKTVENHLHNAMKRIRKHLGKRDLLFMFFMVLFL